jgi:hypothetical protein
MSKSFPIKSSRREFLGTAAGAALGLATLSRPTFAEEGELPPIRAITSGPNFHFFGYYDKFEFDPTNRYVLGLEVDFEHRLPQAGDEVRVGMVDLQDGDRWIELGKSRAWSWQQGCMLQWIPGAKNKVLWNDREGDQFVCRILDVATQKLRTISHPIYTLQRDGRSAVCIDFRRLRTLRPDTGYAGVEDPHADQLAPEQSGIWHVDLETGDQRLILSFAEVAAFGDTTDEMDLAKHFIEHPQFNTDGSRLAFLHRWRPDGGKGDFRTRLMTMSPEGKELFVVDPSGATSHFDWRDPQHILIFTDPGGKKDSGRRFYMFRDRDRMIDVLGKDVMTNNGHCSYLPGGKWILNDTYPDGDRLQHPYVYHVESNARVPLGHFYSPSPYTGPVRCDTHPRFSRDGKLVVIDSPHGGNGRQMYLIDVSKIVA